MFDAEWWLTAITRNIAEHKQMQQRQEDDARIVEIQNLELATQQEELEAQKKDLLAYHRYLKKAQDKAAAATAAKTKFLSNMTDELRAPITATIAFTECLLKNLDGIITGRDMDALRTVDHNTRHLLEMINDILDFSKIDAGKMGLHLCNFDLIAEIRKVAQHLAPLVGGKPIEIVFDLPDHPIPIHTDLTKFTQIVSNLFSNAIKYTLRGTVTILVHQMIDEQLGSVANISVRDTGIGIQSDDKKRLCRKYSQLDDYATWQAGGAGLGLVVTTQYVEMLGGRLDVDSTFGEGSIFTVLLPIETIHESSGEPQERKTVHEIEAA